MKRYEAYKDSGLDWLGEIPAHWKIRRLRFACQVNPSKSEIANLPAETQVSFLPMENIGETGAILLTEVRTIEQVWQGYTYFRDGDVLVAKITPCFENGKGALCHDLLHEIGFGTTELHVLRAKDFVSPPFLAYVTASGHFRMLGIASMYGAAGQQRISDDFVKDFRIALPPRAEQDAIVAFLDRKLAEIDRFIANKERLIELLKEQKAAIINQAVTRGIEPDVPTRASGIEWLGEIPAHWEVMRVKFLLTLIEQGWSPQCEARLKKENEWGVLKVGCVNGYTFNELEHKALPDFLSPKLEYEIKIGDILISRANTRELVGSTALVKKVVPQLLLCDKLYRVRLRENVLAPFFIHIMASQTSRNQIELGASGASDSMQNIGQDVIKNLWVALPSIEEQARILVHIEEQTSGIRRAIHRIEREIELIKEYRTTLIAEAVTGKIDVRAAGGTELPLEVAAGRTQNYELHRYLGSGPGGPD